VGDAVDTFELEHGERLPRDRGGVSAWRGSGSRPSCATRRLSATSC